MAFSWTGDQLSVIDARGQNLLVNAGAGTGKTRALIERLFQLLSDDSQQLSLERVLVVTFTRAATAELRERLAGRLRDAIADEIDAAPGDTERLVRLQGHLAMLPRASVATFDSFCLSLLRENPEAVGLTPDFDIMAEEEALLLHNDALRAAIEVTLADPADGPVLAGAMRQQALTSAVEELVKTLRRFHHFLDALEDPDAWLDEQDRLLAEAADTSIPFVQTRIGARWDALHRLRCTPVLEALDLLRPIAMADSFAKPSFKKYCEAFGPMDAAWQRLANFFTDEHPTRTMGHDGVALKGERSPSGKSPEEAEFNALAKDLKEKREALDTPLRNYGMMTVADMRAAMGAARDYLRVFGRRLGVELQERLLDDHMMRKRLTFGQVQRLALRLLYDDAGATSDVSRRLRGLFEHVLVDEFQDVNEVQAALLRAVSRGQPDDEATPGNFFAVGDMKQAIYGFRNADPRQFRALLDTFHPFDGARVAQPGARIDLRHNFRTAPPLLTLFNDVFASLFSDDLGGLEYDNTQRLEPGSTKTVRPDKPVLSVHLLEPLPGEKKAKQEHDEDGDASPDDDPDTASGPTTAEEREAAWIARVIRDEGLDPGRVAILLRTAKGRATAIVEALRTAGIPFVTSEAVGFLSRQEVSDVLSLLRVIDNPYREVDLVGVLRGPAGGWSAEELVALRADSRRGSYFEALKRAADSGHARAAAFLDRLREWQHAARREGMGLFFARLYEDLALRERVAALPAGESRVANLDALLDRAVLFDSFRRKGLGEFLAFLEQIMSEESDLGAPPILSPGHDAVRIMTMHKSKGLEFPVVIVPFLGTRLNMDDARQPMLWDRRGGLGFTWMPGRRYGEDRRNPLREVVADSVMARLRSEALRLFYVALTRAEERVILVGSATTATNRLAELETLTEERQRVTRERSLLQAGTMMDFVVAALEQRPEFEAFASGAPALSDDGRVEIRLENPVFDTATGQQHETRETLQDRLAAALPEIRAAFERVNALQATTEPPPVRGKISVSEAKRSLEPLDSADAPARKVFRRTPQPDEHPAWWPEALAPERASTGAMRGTLTHRLCALLDLAELAGGGTVAEQLRALVAEGTFTEHEARLVLADDVEHFFRETPVGIGVLRHHARVRRELPFSLGLPVGELLPQHPLAGETIVLQGVVDLLVEDDDRRLVIVDYKTDWWDGTMEHFERLEATYAPQVALYRLGIERAFGRPVAECWLHFLRPRQPLAIDRATADWKEILGAALGR